ncbi:MAG: hypothetical protein H6741_10125 [Alphaproteobacteria bacterium]|nr:hypothetical protein [Alphaproteobacteria bacterium]
MRAYARLTLPDGRGAALGHGDLVGRLRGAALFVDDARVSEGHALLSLRGGALWLLALRGRLAVEGSLRTEVELREGLEVEIAPGLPLRVEECVLPEAVLALQGEGLSRQLLSGVTSLLLEPEPHLLARYTGRAAAWMWSDGEAWRLQLGEGEARPLVAGDHFELGGRRFEVVSVALAKAGGARTRVGLAPPLRVEARYDQARILREGQDPVVIGGISGRIVCELAAIGDNAHWSAVAAEVWPGVEDSAQLRRKWDVAMMRLRRRLREAGLRSELVSGDGCGQVALVLGPEDEVVDLG